jgi:hypothetical protein
MYQAILCIKILVSLCLFSFLLLLDQKWSKNQVETNASSRSHPGLQIMQRSVKNAGAGSYAESTKVKSPVIFNKWPHAQKHGVRPPLLIC